MSDDVIAGGTAAAEQVEFLQSATLPRLDVRPGQRILLSTMNYLPELVSVGRYTGDICHDLAHHGAQVTVITCPPHYPRWEVDPPYHAYRYKKEDDGGIRVYRCPLYLTRKMSGFRRMLAPLTFALSSLPIAIFEMVVRRPNTLVCFEPTILGAIAPVLLAKLLGVRSVLYIQDLELEAALGTGHIKAGTAVVRPITWGVNRTRRLFDQVVTISESMASKLIRTGVNASQIAVVRNWVDITKIKPLTGPNSYRDSLGVLEHQFVVLYAGSIGRKQGLELVVAAAQRLAQHSDIQFIIVGDGPGKASLVEAAAGLPNVVFLPLQPAEMFCELLNAANLHVLPQTAGAADLVLPSKIGGMLASGRPVVATVEPDSEVGRFLGDSAALVPPGDDEALASTILSLSRADLEPMRHAALRRSKDLSRDHGLDAVRTLLLLAVTGAAESGEAAKT